MPPEVRHLPNLNQPEENLFCCGQPSREAIEALRKSGCEVIVNLRPPAECGDFDEAECARQLGLAYHNIPIAGPGDFGPDAVEALDRILKEAGDRPVVIHCASGNRVGALLALHACLKRGMSPQEAIAYGEKSGLAAPGMRAALLRMMKG